MGIQVVIKSSGGNQRVEWLDGLGPLSVGRQQNCSLCIADEHISRQHALLHPEPTNLRVEDTSRNGTLVGRTLLRSSAMSVPYGTPICVGEHTLHVWSPRMRDSATETTATPEPPGAPASDAKAEGAERAHRAAEDLTGESSRIAPSVTIRPEASGDVIAALRREVHRRLLAHLDLTDQAANDHDDPSLRPRVIAALRRIVGTLGTTLPPGLDEKRLIGELADEALGLGPLEQLLADTTVSEIMVVDARTVYVERDGKLMRTAIQFTDDEQLRAIIERIVTPLGRRIDEASPLVDARLGDGSRVNAIIKPLALRGPCITIRKFAHSGFALDRLCELGTTDAAIGRFLSRCVIARKSIVVSGGTGSGKTTLLGALSAAIPEGERIVTIEDAAERRLVQPHVVSLETRPSNLEGLGSYAVRDLVKNALRMRPDRIVVGECRGASPCLLEDRSFRRCGAGFGRDLAGFAPERFWWSCPVAPCPFCWGSNGLTGRSRLESTRPDCAHPSPSRRG